VNYHLWLGVIAVIIAGILQGVFAVPMKYASRWKYENIWLVYAFSGMVVFPWLLAAATVPELGRVYALTSAKTLFIIAGFGACWGIGATLTGVGFSLLGIGLGLAIILALSASLGSLIPLIILNPQHLYTRQGQIYLVATAIMIMGIVFCARAGWLRDTIRGRELMGASRSSFLAGLIVCCSSGVLSSALNFSYAFGSEAAFHALNQGASSIWSTGVVTSLAVSGGFLANFLYCGHLLLKNGTIRQFAVRGAGLGWLCGALMGLFWFGGQSLYGLGISRMGSLGVVVGWPLLMGMIIVTGNAAGVLTGEWNGVSRESKLFLASGMTIILVGLSMLALGQHSS
jgi:L-rhamnose-H+ transport protein